MPSLGTFVNWGPVGRLLNTGAHFETPPYQREYVWGRQRREDLWDDILHTFERDPRDLHFIGVITLIERQQSRALTYVILDGQQRLTTLSLLLCAVRDTIAKDDQDAYHEFHRNVWNTEFNMPRLIPRYTDAHIYRDIARGQRVPRSKSTILSAYRYFARQLENLDTLKPDEVGRAVLNRLQMVWIVLDQPDAITRVFEDLNAKRVQLSQSDLIRSHVFAQEIPEAQEQFDAAHWRVIEAGFQKHGSKALDTPLFDSFFQHLLTCDERKNIPKTHVYRRFLKAPIGQGIGTEITDRLRPRKERYLLIRGRRPTETPSLRDALARVRMPNVPVALPVALAVLDAFAEGEGRLSERECVHTLDMLSSFLVRGHICGRDSRRQWRILPGLCDLGAKEEAQAVVWLRHRLTEADWPSDDEFRRKFVSHSFSSVNFRDAVVRGLERARQASDGYTVEDGAPGIHVEHVMPKSISDRWQRDLGDDWEMLHKQWVDTPGNLALLAGKVNSSIGNLPYEQKKELLTKAKICLNDDFKRYSSWGPAEIEDRAKQLATEALDVWKGPDHPDWR